MNVQSLIGKKIDQTQGFLEDGRRVPLSVILVGGNVISQIKTQDHEGYNALQLGFGNKKRPSKAIAGHNKKAGLDTKSPRFFREVRVDEVADTTLGSDVSVQEVFEPGDMVDVTGTSKGKGFAGVVKKWGFAGGPRTHGQSDRERARGSSGAGTTPGRVYKGKKMAGRMGNEQVTVKNLEVLSVDGETLLVRGLIPGSKGSIVVVKKVGKNKKLIRLWSEKGDEEAKIDEVQVEESMIEEASEQAPVSGAEVAQDNVQAEAQAVATSEEKVETTPEPVQAADASAVGESSTDTENSSEATKEEVKQDAS